MKKENFNAHKYAFFTTALTRLPRTRHDGSRARPLAAAATTIVWEQTDSSIKPHNYYFRM